MKKFLLVFFFFSFGFFGFAQTVYEDFEGTPLPWNGSFGDGTFNGAVDNPATDGINSSAKCGSYTKSDQHSFSLLIAILDSPMDLSVNNEFHLMVNSPVATQVLLKLEGAGEAIEATKNIANINVWQEYVFDFSAASAFSTIDKIILFFDPGVMDSGDTYLFDNIVAHPAGACAGTIVDSDIIDDFECQRNATYGGGWDIIMPVANPDASGINTSTPVGQYGDPLDEWSALVIDYNSPIDLSTKNTIKAKVWAPKTGQMLFKLEGGVSGPAERFIPVTETNTWVEYSVDFSDQSNADHKKIAIFFNAGVLAEEGDIYYIDDISFAEPPPAAALEDFEDGANLAWEPLNGDMAVHGTFDGVIANPDQSGINDSPNVGSYTKGSSSFSTLSAFLPSGIDLSESPQVNLQVLAPEGAAKVTLQLTSPTQGIKDVTRDISATMEWVQLEFNFEEFSDITDFERINILFDAGTGGAGTTYLYDNLTQGESTVDPCEGVEPIPNIVDDFECQRNTTYGAGTDRLTVVNNLDVSAANSSSMVGEYKDPLDAWSALGMESGGSLDLSVLNQFHIKIWSAIEAPLLFKLEGGSSGAFEVWSEVSATGEWQEYIVDFSSQAAEDHARIVVFFNAGQEPSMEDLYYIDDMSWTRATYTGCVDDHESVVSSISNFQYFANGHLETEGLKFEITDNPNIGGINTSDKVGKFIKASDGLPFAGMFADLDAPIDFGSNKTARAKVLMDHIGNFAIKVEGSQTGAPGIEIPVDNTVSGEWEELTFDFSAVADDAKYMRLTVFFDLGIDATGVDVTSYFDDIIFGDGTCPLSSGIFEPIRLERFTLSPNPVSDLLFVEKMAEVEQIAIFNALGQKVQSIKLVNTDAAEINVAGLDSGIYILAGYDKTGNLIANAKFVKK